jgi:WD40 repeat protein
MSKNWHDVYQAALITCLTADVKREYVLNDSEGLETEAFVAFFADTIYDRSSRALREWLTRSVGFSDLKAYLFVVFRSIDTDESGTASWEEVVEYLIEERLAATEALDEAQQRWELSQSLRYSTAARIHLAQMGHAGGDPVVCTQPMISGRDVILPLAAVMKMQYLEPCGLLLATSRLKAELMEPGSWRIAGTIPEAGGGVVAAAMPRRIGNTDTMITTHRDATVRVWTVKDSLSTDQKIFECDFVHEFDSMQSSVAASRLRPNLVFAGGMDGSVTQLDTARDLLLDYRRGDAAPFTRIITQRWAPGDWHRDSVTAMTFMEGLGSTLATVSRDATMCLRDAENAASGLRHLPHKKGLLAVTTTRSCASLVICAGFDPSVFVWDAMSHAPLPSMVLSDYKDPHLAAIVGVEASRHAPVTMSLDATAKLKLWDLRMGRCFQTILLEPKASQSAPHVPINCSISVSRATSRVYVAAKGLHLLEVKRESEAECCFHSDIIAVAFCERSSHIMTVHTDAVVLWASDTGCIVAVHRYRALPLPQLEGEPEEPEAICAFVLATSGVNYSIATTRGRITRHRQRSGEIIADTGRIHNCEIKHLLQATPQNDSEFLLSIGVDNSCVVTSKSMRLPPHLPPPFHSHSVTAVVFTSSAQQLFFGSEVPHVVIADPYTMAARGVQSRLQADAECVTGLLALDSLSALAVAGTSGVVSLWGVKPHARSGYQLLRFAATAGGPAGISALAANDSAARTVLFVGDESGRVGAWELAATADGAITASALWKAHLHDARVTHLCYVVSARRLVSGGGDRMAFVLTMSGAVTGQLCHARGSEHAVWTRGIPTYDFPDLSHSQQNERARALKVIRLVQRFITVLKLKAEKRRSISLRRSFLQRKDTGLSGRKSATLADSFASSSSESAPSEAHGDSVPSLPPPDMGHAAEPPALEELPMADASASLMLRPAPPARTRVPLASDAGRPRPSTAPRRYRATGDTYLDKIAKGPTTGLVHKVRLTTEERIVTHQGFLTVLESQAHGECSNRATVRVMDRVYRDEAATQRRLRELQTVETKFRHAVRASDQKKYEAAAVAVRQMKRDAEETEARQQRLREERLRGPPLPPPMVSRRAPNRR